MKKDHKAKHYVLAVVLIVVAVLLDQYTKYLAVTNLKDKPAFVLWDKVFELTYLENRGGSVQAFCRTGSSFYMYRCCDFVFILYCYIRIPKTGVSAAQTLRFILLLESTRNLIKSVGLRSP